MSDTQQIKDKIDIVELIGEYVSLKSAGTSHKGLCPFHHEKTPSFMVSRDRQSWYCFGCNKGGDLFTFLQEIEGMEFVEALKYLANRAGVPLTNTRQDVDSSQKNRIKDINARAASFFHHILVEMDGGGRAREYLKGRGVSNQTIEVWQIGFIPDQWDLITQYLLKKGHSIDDLVASGLTIKREGAQSASGRGFYDRFRGRVMFPITDNHGTIVGFTGRVLVETDTSGGKYVNTPQTLVYDKSRVVFGLDKAKQEIKKKNLIVMVEGQMDVIASHQAGVTNVVATSGTALTSEQISLLKRYATRIAVGFDADPAGQAAVKRGIDLALEAGMDVRVIRIPDGAGKDPDECIRKNSVVWIDAIEEASDVMHWYFERAFRGKDTKNPKQKQQIVNEILPEIKRIPFAVERDHWLKDLAGRIGVELSILREEMKSMKSQEIHSKTRAGGGDTRAIDVRPTSPAQPLPGRLSILMERLILLLLTYPKLGINPMEKYVESALSTSVFGVLYEGIKKQYTIKGSLEVQELVVLLSKQESFGINLDMLLMKADKEFSHMEDKQAKEEYLFLVEKIAEEVKQERRKKLENEIQEAEKAGDSEKITKLLEAFTARDLLR